MKSRRNARAGYTLVELAVVLAILAILSGIIFTSRGTGQDQLLIIREKAEIINLFYRAKAMSLQRFSEKGGNPGQPQDVCAFGVVFDPGVLNGSFLFGDVADQVSDECKESGVYMGNVGFDNKDYKFSGPDDFFNPDPRAVLTITDDSGATLSDFTILFVPPDPTPTLTAGALFPITINIAVRGSSQAPAVISLTAGGLIEEL